MLRACSRNYPIDEWCRMLGRYLYHVLRPFFTRLTQLREELKIGASFPKYLGFILMLASGVFIVANSFMKAEEAQGNHLFIVAAAFIIIGIFLETFDVLYADEKGRHRTYQDVINFIMKASGEFFVLFGSVVFIFTKQGVVLGSFAVFTLLTTSMIYFLKSAGEHLIDHFTIGLSSRFERMAILILFMFFFKDLTWGMMLILFINVVTMYQMIHYLYINADGGHDHIIKRR